MNPRKSDSRQALAERAPRLLRSPGPQRIITHLTGVAFEGEALPERTQLARTAQAFGTYAAGVVVGIAAPAADPMGWVVLPAACILAVGGARDLQLTIYHHCAHGNVLNSKWSKIIGRAIDKLILIERFDAYQSKHTIGHHGRNSVSTHDDATVTFLCNEVGIEPGLPAKENRRRFCKALTSPLLHLRMFGQRIKSQFVDGTWSDRAFAAGHIGAAFGTAQIAGWEPVIAGWFLPLTIGYQMAQCARLAIEHHWAETPAPNGKRDAAAHDELTVPVRCAIAPPSTWTLKSSLAWSLEMAFNGLIRFAVLPGDSGPSHHWHHGEARGDWANHIRAAAVWEARRRTKGIPPSQEAWGYREALSLAFESYAKATSAALEAPQRVRREA